jgi:hypothetical protein
VDVVFVPAGTPILRPHLVYRTSQLSKSPAVGIALLREQAFAKYYDGLDVHQQFLTDKTKRKRLNGKPGDIDFRHQFDVYLSRTRLKVVENGRTLLEGALPSPLAEKRWNIALVGALYHTDNELGEMKKRPNEILWQRDPGVSHRRAYSHEFHWDNVGVKMLSLSDE